MKNFLCVLVLAVSTSIARGQIPPGYEPPQRTAGTPAGASNTDINWRIQFYDPITVAVGDTVTFTWRGSHGVDSIPSGECPSSFENNPEVTTLAPVANGGTYVWTAEAPGTYYVACPVPSHCPSGMLLEIAVA